MPLTFVFPGLGRMAVGPLAGNRSLRRLDGAESLTWLETVAVAVRGGEPRMNAQSVLTVATDTSVMLPHDNAALQNGRLLKQFHESDVEMVVFDLYIRAMGSTTYVPTHRAMSVYDGIFVNAQVPRKDDTDFAALQRPERTRG